MFTYTSYNQKYCSWGGMYFNAKVDFSRVKPGSCKQSSSIYEINNQQNITDKWKSKLQIAAFIMKTICRVYEGRTSQKLIYAVNININTTNFKTSVRENCNFIGEKLKNSKHISSY